jgi:hypothetical protein
MKTKELELYNTGDAWLVILSALFLGPAFYGTAFWFTWKICHIGETYFSFLPEVWQTMSWFDCMCLFVCLSIVRTFSKS